MTSFRVRSDHPCVQCTLGTVPRADRLRRVLTTGAAAGVSSPARLLVGEAAMSDSLLRCLDGADPEAMGTPAGGPDGTAEVTATEAAPVAGTEEDSVTAPETGSATETEPASVTAAETHPVTDAETTLSLTCTEEISVASSESSAATITCGSAASARAAAESLLSAGGPDADTEPSFTAAELAAAIGESGGDATGGRSHLWRLLLARALIAPSPCSFSSTSGCVTFTGRWNIIIGGS